MATMLVAIMSRVRPMDPLIEQHRDEIERLCRTYSVTRLELFGSAARGEADPHRSDLDFLVEFQDLGWKGSFQRYMRLKLGLEDLLGRPVDLVEPSAIVNPYFSASVNRNRVLVYAAA
jgi:predicted nucleotidyltransferase